MSTRARDLDGISIGVAKFCEKREERSQKIEAVEERYEDRVQDLVSELDELRSELRQVRREKKWLKRL